MVYKCKVSSIIDSLKAGSVFRHRSITQKNKFLPSLLTFFTSAIKWAKMGSLLFEN